MLDPIKPFLQKPPLFHPGTTALWTDNHISKSMLEAHLHPLQDAATRNHEFVKSSVDWITALLPPSRFPTLLDLGCGPGIYAEKFYHNGYDVTGVDFSPRSIQYATQQAQIKQLPIAYRQESYLDMAFQSQFDLATLIFCDFGVLPPANRSQLLKKIYRALKPHGTFVFDVFSPNKYNGMEETKSWGYHDAGFFKPTPYISLDTFYRYDEDSTYLNQNIIITDASVECFNIWEHTFTIDELKKDLTNAGFSTIQFFGDIAGTPCTGKGNTICAVAAKG